MLSPKTRNLALAVAKKNLDFGKGKSEIGERDKGIGFQNSNGAETKGHPGRFGGLPGAPLSPPSRSGFRGLKMARNRMLRPTIWTDEKFAECSPNARLTFVLCISQADDAGILCIQPKILHSLLWFGIPEPPALKVTEGLIQELIDQHFLIPYEVDKIRYAFLPNWFAHQKIDHPSLTQNPPPNLPVEGYSPNVSRMIAEWSAKARLLFPERSPQTRLKESKIKEKKNTFLSENQNFSDEVIFLTSFLISKIKFNDPKAKTPELVENGGQPSPAFRKWATEIDRLIRIDKREAVEIEKVIIWCQEDSFWKSNILSAPKLRKQFPQLVLKMKNMDWIKPIGDLGLQKDIDIFPEESELAASVEKHLLKKTEG